MKSPVKFRFFVWGVTGALSLIFLIYPRSLSPKTGSYSLSLDLDHSSGDQSASSLDASPNQVITIQVFGRDLQNADRFSALFEYDATQVVCEKFAVGDVFPNPLVELDSITVVQHNETSVLQVDISSSGKSKTASDNLIGTLRFRTTDAFSSTEIQLARAGLGREGQFETATTPISVALQIPAAPSPDFDGNGTVDFPDFLAFVSVYGTQAGQYKYDAKYDLNRDGKIAFEDFEILTLSFGRTAVARKPPTPPKISPQSTPASSPDLIVESPAVSDSILDAGARFTLSVTVRNRGAGTSPVLMRLDYYQSIDETISTGDTQVGWDLVSRLAASETSVESVRLSAPSSGGTYYYGACIEVVSGESDTGNNCSSAVTLTVGSPDLVVGSPAVSESNPKAGSYFRLSATVRNQGGGRSSSTTLRYYLSTDETISISDTEVGTDYVSRLDASASSDESVRLRAPSTEGRHYYGACVESVIGESDTGNNCSSAAAVTVTAGTTTTPPGPNRTGNRKGIWSDGTTMWVADDAQGEWFAENNDKIYAYVLATRARDPSKDFNTLNAAGNDDPEGIWSDGTTMWVADQSEEKLYAYDMTTRERVPARDFNTLDAAGNDEPTGIWSDGTTMWVADDAQGEWFAENNDKIYAYVLATRARDPSKDFNTLNAAGNDDPEGIWSDGTTMWVADQSDEKLYAYDMTSGNRVPARDFNTLDAAGNDEPTGIWSDGTTMWVADQSDGKLYAYDMTSGNRVPARDFDTRDPVSPDRSDAPPGRPDAPTITATTLNSLSIRWTAPTNSGPAINDYDVQYRETGGSFADWPHTGTGTTTSITGLTTNTRYEVQVRATNDEGTGDWSPSGSGTTGSSGTGGGGDGSPNLIVETPQPLTEPTLNGSVVTLTLTGAAYERSIFDIRDNVEVSGVAGVSVGTFGIRRVSDTVVTVELTFNGNLDTDGTLTFTVGADAIANYNGPAFTGTLSVTAVEESVVASTPQPLTEATLNGSVVTLTLTGAAYERSIFDIQDNVEVSGVAGVGVGTFGIRRVSDTVVTVKLAFSGNLDADGTLTFTVRADAIASYNGAAITGTLPVTAVEESVVASTPRPLTEATLNGSVVTLTLTGAAYERFVFNIRDNVEVSGVAGVSVGTFGIRRVSDTVVAVTLAFSGNLDTDGTLTFTVRAGAIASYNGPAFTGTLPVTAGSGSGSNQAPTFSEGASTARSLAENTGAGQNIGNPISATDDDGDRLTYSLEGRDAAAFTIISGSGQLRTRSGVRYDYETKSSYSVTVQVRDGRGGSATIAVTITLTDENEAPDRPDAPVVTASTLNSLSIRWTAPANPGSAISDYDVQYKEAGGSFADWPHTGTGTTTTITGLTANTRYEIQVRATNARGISPWSPSVTGTTTDNQSPAFSEGTNASRSLAENTGAGRNVGNPVSATDDDGDRLTYSLEGRDATAFTIRSNNGQLMTGSGETYNYETKDSYSVTVRAQDGKGGSATIAVTISLTDESEPPGRPIAPTVTASSNSLSMRWTAPANSGPAISGYDVQYRAAGGSFTDWPHTGASTTTSITGLTANTRYEVQVRATNDEGTGDWSPSGSGTTGSTGTNDPDLIVESPSVDNNTLSPEQSFRLSATVRNQGGERSSSTTLRYYLSTDETMSTSDTEVGTDYVSRLDAAASSDESVRLRAPSSKGTYYYGACVESVSGESDTGNNCSGAVAVTVLSPDLIVEPPSVDNNAPTPGRRIRLSATVRNQGGGRAPSTTLRYYLSTDETIDRSDTEIGTDYVSSLDPSETSDERDFVSAPSSAGRYYYGACVETVAGESDTGNNCSGAVIVTVRSTPPPPAPNQPPVFSEGASTTRSMAENTGAGQNIGNPISATDSDGDRLTYSLQGRDASAFNISAGSGQLMTRSGVSYDYETQNNYSVTVRVQDGEGGSATIAVTITLTDENEPPDRPDAPVVTVSTLNSLSLSWTAPTNTGSPISDYDVQYRESGGNFTDWPHTGTGTAATITGLTANTRYEVQVRATSDEGTGDWSPSVTGTTTDNQSPEFSEGTNTTRSLAENTGAGQNIGNPVSATDGDGDRLTYSLQGRDASSFAIQSNSGQLMTGSGVTYNYEIKDSYSVTVRAEDGEGGSATIGLEITLNDENEPPDRPAAPVVMASSNSLSVRWAEPGNTGPVVNDYDVQYRAMGGSFADWSHIGPGLSTTIAGLMPETRYEVQVRATNDEGTSDWSPSGNDTTVRPPPGFAPIDQNAFNAFARNKILSVETYYIEFESAGRFEENNAYPGSYTYANTGSNTGILTQNYDGGHLGGTCTIEMTFSSTTTGTLRARCGSEQNYDSPQEWRLSDPPDPNAFNIEVIWVGDEPSAAHAAAFNAAVARWESIITSDIPDVFVSSSDGGTIEGVKVFGLVDDLRIYARLADIDGPGETLGSAGPRTMREQSKLPIVARMTFDTSDLGEFTLEALQDLYLHEMGHCLGIGTVWKRHGLLENPSIEYLFFIIPVEVDGADTHFAGAGAIEAFNDAGGTHYADGKVPVENEKGGAGTRDGHWRQSVFGPNELMEGFLSPGVAARDPLSAITIQSLADLGYVVDVGQADAYTLPSPVAAKLAIASEHQIPINCLLTEPIGEIDEYRQIELKPTRLNRTHDR
ncbi:MAG: fibronectin type III domain-containing protein [Gemmatimonadota bacterium]|nr:fibronectin type III domain-containing protein [Gemmatimonadota bacterium]